MMPIYLDYAATTPLDPAVGDAMAPWTAARFGNPASPHRWGYEAAAAVAVAQGHVADLLGVAPATVTFTGGATEAVNWALKGVMLAAPPGRRRLVTLATEHSCVLETARWLESVGCGLTVVGVGRDGRVDRAALAAPPGRRRLVTLATEHSCVLETAHWLESVGCGLTVVAVGRDGRVDPAALAAAMGPDVALVAAMLVNNETGVSQPVAEIAALAHAAGALMLCDAAQGFGKVDCSGLDADLVSVSGHKLYGPKGVGALYRRPGVTLVPLLHGGDQGDGRSGTLSPALCVGLGTAAAVAGGRMADDAAHAARLERRLLSGLAVPVAVNGGEAPRWPGIVNLSFAVDATRLLAAAREIAVSTGSACSSTSGRPSHVLAAMGAGDGVRISFGRFTTDAEIDTAAAVLSAAVRRLGARAA